MSFRWPYKDPDESLNYSIDWSRFLGDDKINSVTWHIDDADGVKTPVLSGDTVNALTYVSGTFTSTVATARFSGGTNGTTYKITCTIDYGTSNLIVERKVQLPVRER